MFYDFIYHQIGRYIPLHLEGYHDMETGIDNNCTKGTNLCIAYIFYIILIFFLKDYDDSRLCYIFIEGRAKDENEGLVEVVVHLAEVVEVVLLSRPAVVPERNRLTSLKTRI